MYITYTVHIHNPYQILLDMPLFFIVITAYNTILIL